MVKHSFRADDLATSAKASERARRGAVTVELAVLLPFLIFLFVITVDYARIFYFATTVTNCASVAAIYGSQDPTSANDTSGIITRAQLDAGDLDVTQLNVSSSTDSATSPTTLTVTVSYKFTTITNFPGVPKQTTLTRTVQMNVTPSVPG
jgi:Flp pilus assembly protein TadG